VRRLPRIALLLLCAAYLMPGLLGRGPWKSADITAFGYMVNMAEGRTSWFAPAIAGLPSDGALLQSHTTTLPDGRPAAPRDISLAGRDVFVHALANGPAA